MLPGNLNTSWQETRKYIEKTNDQNSRFSNGHLPAIKLHNPIYNNDQKRCTLVQLLSLYNRLIRVCLYLN